MDEQVKLIVEAVKKTIDSPRERQAAIIRAGLLAQAYANCDDEILEQVFALCASGVLKDDIHLRDAGVVERR